MDKLLFKDCMYIPNFFEITNKDEILAFIKANAFGQLVSTVEGRLFSSHIPFLLSDDGHSLHCHVAKNNPQWKGIEKQEVLVTFQGPHAYISPSWYSSPGVPTWNYQAVHVYGKAKQITKEEDLISHINEMILQFESSFENPWNPQFRESLLQAVIGIEIHITEVQGKYKLSQNRPKDDRKQVIDELASNGSKALSEAMNRNEEI